MPTNNTSFSVTQTSSGVSFDISSEDINIVIASGSGSNIFYMINRATSANVIVDESHAAVSAASGNLIPLTNTENTATFYMNPDKIAELIDNGTGTKILFNLGDQTTERYVVDESRAVIRALIASKGAVLSSFRYTIGAPGVAGCDYNFTSVANTTEQSIQLGGTTIIGANDAVVSMVVVCITGMNGIITGILDVGITSGSAEYINSNPLPVQGATMSVGQVTYPLTTESSVYFSVTPDANWSTMTQGKWSIEVIRENIL